MIEEFTAKLEQNKVNRIEIINNEVFELLSNLTMKKVDLKNEIKILLLKLEELKPPKKVVEETIEDKPLQLYNFYYY